MTHSSVIKKLIVLNEQVNREKPKKFRVFTQNSEIYPFTFEFYDNIISDAREKDGSQMREPRLKVPKPKKAATGDESKSPSKKKR